MVLGWKNQMYRKILCHLGKYECGLDMEIIEWKKTDYMIVGIGVLTFWLIKNKYWQILRYIYAYKIYGKIHGMLQWWSLSSRMQWFTLFFIFACLYFLIFYKAHVIFKGYWR